MSAARLRNLSTEDRAIIKHWSEYGQRGATPLRRILPSDWPGITPFINPKSREWRVPIAAHQMPLLLKGFMPSESDTASIQEMLAQGLFHEGDFLQSHAYMSASEKDHTHISEDKWFVCADGPDADGCVELHMYRSWTGLKVVQLSIQTDRIGTSERSEAESSAEITRITWEAGDGVSEAEDEEWAKDSALGVCEWVLNVDLEETKQKERLTPEELSIEFDRVMNGLPKTSSQTLNRTGQNPGRGARAFNHA